MAGELEAVFEEADVHGEGRGADGFDLGVDDGEAAAVGGGGVGLREGLDVVGAVDVLDACLAGDAGEVGAGAGGGREAADGEQALVVEDEVGQVGRRVTGQGAEGAEIHQQGGVAVEDGDLLVGQGEGEAEAHGGGEAHAVLEVEEVGPVAEVVELDGHGAHDGDDDLFPEAGVDGFQCFGAQHISPSVSSWQGEASGGPVNLALPARECHSGQSPVPRPDGTGENPVPLTGCQSRRRSHLPECPLAGV